jgi:hypothetical protein
MSHTPVRLHSRPLELTWPCRTQQAAGPESSTRERCARRRGRHRFLLRADSLDVKSISSPARCRSSELTPHGLNPQHSDKNPLPAAAQTEPALMASGRGRGRQQGGVLSLTLRPVVLTVKSFFDRRQLRPCHRLTMGRRRAPPFRLSAARVRQRALLASSSRRSCAEQDCGVRCCSVKAAATTRR